MGAVFNSLSCYTSKPDFETNVSNILDGLSAVLTGNCLNYHVQNICEVIGIFVKCQYKYYSNRKIETEALQNFYNWITDKDEEFQQIIIRNIINRLNTIEYKNEDDLPF